MGNVAVKFDQYGLFDAPEDHINFLHNKKLAEKIEENLVDELKKLRARIEEKNE